MTKSVATKTCDVASEDILACTIRFNSETHQTVKPSIQWHQLLATLAATIGSAGFGTVIAYSATALPDMRKQESFDQITPSQETWIGSLTLFGAILGSPVAGALVDWIGRRGTLICAMPFFILGWLLISFAQTIEMMYAGRLVTGLIGGIISLVVPIFISEISSPQIRGALTSCFDVSITVGILYIYLIGTWINWRYQALCCAILPVLSAIFLLVIHESPRYLIDKGNAIQAKKATQWYNSNCSYDITTAVEDPHSRQASPCPGIEAKETHSWKEIFSLAVLKPLSINLMLAFFYEGSGMYPITAYTVDIFHTAGTDIDDNLSTILVGILQVVATLIAAVTVDRCGRRLLLLLSEGFQVLSMMGMSTFFYLKSHPSIYPPDKLSWLPLASLLVYVVAFSIGIGPIVWIYLGEVLPMHFKGKGSGIVVAFSFALSFVITLEFSDLMDAVGYAGGYGIFAGVSFFGFLYVLFFLPETKGKTLEEIQAYFN